MHVGFDEAKVGGRLWHQGTGTADAPIIMGETGGIVDRDTHLEVYQASGLAPSKNQAKKKFDAMWTMAKSNAGVFMDLQQAAKALRDALNSSAGQAALGALDGGSKREFFTAAVTGMGAEARKMYTAHMDALADKSDLTHVATFTEVTVGIDAMNMGGVHLQTLYPVE